MLSNALRFSHTLLKELVQPGNVVVDATMGNGNDTLLLAELVGKTGHVYAFDVQQQALDHTKARLVDSQLESRATLIKAGHEHFDDYFPSKKMLTAAIFNLGYLPQSDELVKTLPETTEAALMQMLQKLAPRGRIIVVSYHGHPGGESELSAVQHFCQQLPEDQFSVINYQFVNYNEPLPILFCIEKHK
jgi:16S rRNA C1402 N4-methylase RsmH